MKISLLVHNLSGNNVVRVYPIAKVLERFSSIEVVGFVDDSGIFPPYEGEFPAVTLPRPKTFSLGQSFSALLERISGDVLYAFKPHPLSFGFGLLAARKLGRPLVLDIEDFDLAFQFQRGPLGFLNNALRFWNVDSFGWLLITDLLTSSAQQIIVGSTFLRRRYGGTIVPHGADTSVFDPSRFEATEVRHRWGLRDEFVILFAGKASEHKGVESLARIVFDENASITSRPLRLVIVGGSADTPLIRHLKELAGESVVHIPSQPHARMPEILSMADLVVLPQKKTLYTRAQIPGKVYEAMAMAKPIISSAVSDLPIILKDCGILVEPDNDHQLRSAIRSVYDDPEQARRMGRKARERCEERYSWSVMGRILQKVFGHAARS